MTERQNTRQDAAHGAAAPPWRRPPSTLWIVLPAYNEEQDLGPLLERIDQVMHEDGTGYHVLLVDDGSTDGTAEVADHHGQYMPIRLLRHEANQGLGATIRDGLRAAAADAADHDIVVVMDADNTHTPGLIRRMASRVREGHDVVVASRYQPGSNVRGVALHRRLLSYAGNLLFRILLPIHGIRDYTCGYRAYRAGALQRAFEQMGDDLVSEDGFQCMVDILLKLRTMDLVFGEVPLILRYDLKAGTSKMRLGRTIGRTLALLMRRRFGR